MEFSLHLPQNIDKDGSLWQMWSNFYQKFQYHQSTNLQKNSLMGATSLLLFAAHHQVTSICSSLKIYDIDLAKLNKVLHVVEQACLPHFILLFERFRYFNLKCDSSGNLADFTVILRKQGEVCEFGSQEDNIMADILYKSVKSETQVQDGPDADELQLDNGCELSDPEDGRNKMNSAESSSAVSSVARDKDMMMFDLSNDAVKSGSKHSAFHVGKIRYKSSLCVNKDKMSKLTGKQKKRKVEKREHQRHRTVNAFTHFEKSNENSDVPSVHSNEVVVGSSMKAESTFMGSRNMSENPMMSKRFCCCFCEKAFAGELCLKKHLSLKHVDDTEFSCRICEYVALNVQEYLAHCRSAHVAERPKQQPNDLTPTKSKIKKEMRKFHCSLCRRVFPKEGYLRLHIHYSHAKNFLCWNCGESFQTLSDYRQHSEKHVVVGRFTCDLCQRQNHSITRLVGHLKNHLMPRNKCEICGIVFTKPESLARHTEKHRDEPSHKCNVCGKNFVMEARLQYHMRTHSGEKRFTCEICGKTYAQKMNLVHHKRWHTGEQPFECEICGKRTRSSGDLNKHKRKHSDKRSYVCEVCGRGFNYSSALIKHRMGHTGKRSYACDVCGRTFIYREGLRDHIKASRCPGRRSETGYNRTPRTTKLLQSGMLDNLVDIEAKPYIQVLPQSASGSSQKDVEAWHCMLRNNESGGGTSVVLVPPFY